MARVLGQGNSNEVKPLIGETWADAKAFWFHVFGYEMHSPEVVDFHASDARTKIISAPARTSKSFSGAFDVLPYGFPTRPLMDSLHWSVGYNYDTNKEFDYWWDTLVLGHERLEHSGLRPSITRHRNNPGSGDMEIVIEWGRGPDGRICRSVFKGMTSQNEKSLQGEQVTSAILSEAAEHESHIMSKYLSTRTWRIVLPTTPKPKAEWIRRLIQDSERDSNLGIGSWTFTPHANPDYNWDVFREEKAKAAIRAKEMFGSHAEAEDDPYFAEQFLGHWVYYTGRVLPFNRRRHVIKVLPELVKNARVFVSHDYGYRDAAVTLFWAVAETGELVIFDEIYEAQLTTPELVQRTQERLESWGIQNFAYSTGDPKKPEVAVLMREAGLNVISVNKKLQASREAGTRRLVDLMVAGPFQVENQIIRPGVYVDERCIRTIQEWENLRYREGVLDEYGNAVFQGADHAFDAARYAVMTLPRVYSDEDDRDWLAEARYKTSDAYVQRTYFPEGQAAWL